MRLVFIMDPVSTVQVDAVTSFAIMLEAARRGHCVDHCLASDVRLEEGRVLATVRAATMKRDPLAPIVLGAAETVDLADVDRVFLVELVLVDADDHFAARVTNTMIAVSRNARGML